MTALYGIGFVAFMVAIIAAVCSSASSGFKTSADVALTNAKKYNIALIKAKYRKKYGESYRDEEDY